MYNHAVLQLIPQTQLIHHIFINLWQWIRASIIVLAHMCMISTLIYKLIILN